MLSEAVIGKVEMGALDRIEAMTVLSGHGLSAKAVAPLLTDEDRAAVTEALSRATPPADVGPVPVAPARGAMRIVQGFAMEGNARLRTGAHLEECTVLDEMMHRAAQRHEASGSDAPFVRPFTTSQLAMAREYRGLVERYAAGGVRCASLEAGRGGGSGGEFIDAFIAVGERLRLVQARIGTGSALVLRRIRPSVRGSRVGIPDRALVDMVCLGGLTLGQVLQRHGWANNGQHRGAALTALCGALDRMQG